VLRELSNEPLELTTDPGSEVKTRSTLKHVTFKLKLILISSQSKQHVENIEPNSYTFKLKFIQHFNQKAFNQTHIHIYKTY